jgi:hypothetical protein
VTTLGLMPVLQAMMIGGVIGLVLFVLGASAWIWIFGEPPAGRAVNETQRRFNRNFCTWMLSLSILIATVTLSMGIATRTFGSAHAVIVIGCVGVGLLVTVGLGRLGWREP